MAIAQSKLTAQGQISVPAEVRRRLGVGPGSVLEWDDHGEQIVVRRAATFSSDDIHRAIFRKPPKAKTIDEIEQGIARHMKKRYARR